MHCPVYRSMLLVSTLILAGCTNRLTTRVHVYNPVQRQDQLRALVDANRATRQQNDIYQQLRQILSKPPRERYDIAWHDHIVTVIDSHGLVADQLITAAKQIVTLQILTPARQQNDSELEGVEAAITTARDQLANAKLQRTQAMGELEKLPEAPANDETAAKQPAHTIANLAERVALMEQAVKDAESKLDKSTQLQNELKAYWTQLNQELQASIARYSDTLRGTITETRMAFDLAYREFIGTDTPQRGGALAFATRALLQEFLVDFWEASDFRAPVSSQSTSMEASVFDFANPPFLLKLPGVLQSLYGPKDRTVAELSKRAIDDSLTLADSAARAAARDAVIRNDIFEESVTNPLVTLAQGDKEGWHLNVATAHMESNVKSSIVVVRDTPASFNIVSYDGNAASTVSEGLRATTNTALLALEAARIMSGVGLSRSTNPSNTANNSSEPPPPSIPVATFRAIAKDRLAQTVALAAEKPSTDPEREDWARRVRALIDSTPFLPTPQS